MGMIDTAEISPARSPGHASFRGQADFDLRRLRHELPSPRDDDYWPRLDVVTFTVS